MNVQGATGLSPRTVSSAATQPSSHQSGSVDDCSFHRYEMPREHRSKITEIFKHPDWCLAGPGVTEAERKADSAARGAFRERRIQLHTDASHCFEDFERDRTAQGSRMPRVSGLEPNTSQPELIRKIMQSEHGMMIGESHAALGSKKLLIDNMPTFAREGVKILFMEHLFSDLHQSDVDSYFESPHNVMPPNLEKYLNRLDQGHRTDSEGQFTFLKVVEAAHKAGIKVIAIDCAASYCDKDIKALGLGNDVAMDQGHWRGKMMNYFASRVINSYSDTGKADKWVALVGNSHIGPYRNVPSLTELTGGIGIRVADADEDSVTQDPGERLLRTVLSADDDMVIAQGDLLLRVKIDGAPHRGLPQTCEDVLRCAGQFFIDTQGSQIQHHSNAGEIIVTPIRRDEDGKCYIERPRWTAVHEKRYQTVNALVKDLQEKIRLTRVPCPVQVEETRM